MRLCAAVAVSALSFALVTGCSDGGSKESADKGSARKALSATELRKLIVTQGDLHGYQVGAVTEARARRITTDKAACEPLTRVMSGLTPTEAPASTDRMVTENAAKRPSAEPTSLDDLDEGEFEETMRKSLDRDVTTVALASYGGDGAERALTTLSAAVRRCAGGFTGRQAGTSVKFTEVTAEKPVGGGDASVAFAATMEEDGSDGGGTAPVHAEVDRHGSTVSVYFTSNLGAMMAKKAYTVTPAVVKAQETRLR
ncbi:hypothetical protein VT52_013235 [Streptomyces malaysiense]|uniref:Lipoprotein n=1 Tax=Streptomyces malaysiense TaxID=1428626 RepID=A0A1J4Q1W0_9ACTN|nr:hypothetical protein VT52_013235 [Streptomyces malaysiense]